MKSSEMTIRLSDQITLKGNLNVPSNPEAFVIFSHGSGSSRFSSRNRFVAEFLNRQQIATLLVDLLTEAEDRIYQNRFNIELLTDRLIEVTNYSTQLPDLINLPTGYFGASTGAASALFAAARIPDKIHAVVSRGGRPDLAIGALENVKSPTLLIVGGKDFTVIDLNKEAYSKLQCEKEMQIIAGAGHLFEEAYALEEVASLAGKWFHKYLVKKIEVLK